MEVILLKNYPQLGYTGEVVNVASGFARNFLLVKGIAEQINSKNKKAVENRKKQISLRVQQEKESALEIAEKLNQFSTELEIRVDEKGKSYGSVPVKDLIAKLEKDKFMIDPHQISRVSLNKGGDYTIPIKLHTEVEASIAVKVKEIKPKKSGKKEKAKDNTKKE